MPVSSLDKQGLAVQAPRPCAPPNDGSIRASAILASKEYQLVAHLQSLYEEAQRGGTEVDGGGQLPQQPPEGQIQQPSGAQGASQGKNGSSTGGKPLNKLRKGGGHQQAHQERNLKVQNPLITPDLLRRELFKLYYATQNPEKFDLYKKADASEFFQSVLELIHFCLNKNQAKENIDSYCGVVSESSQQSEAAQQQVRPCPRTSCQIHQIMFQNVYVVKRCPCSPEKQQPFQEYHQNNFMYIVNAQEIIDMQAQILRAAKKSGPKKYKRCELELFSGKLIYYCKALHDKSESKCEMGAEGGAGSSGGAGDIPQAPQAIEPSEGGAQQALPQKGPQQPDAAAESGENCKYKQTQHLHCIRPPYPEVIALNINWFNNQVPYMDTLRFCSAIPQRMVLDELYNVVPESGGAAQQEGGSGGGGGQERQSQQGKDDYILRSVVCFLGAHYMTYVKHINTVVSPQNNGALEYYPIWKLYDDYKPIKTYTTWKELLEKILEYGTLPTVLIYEKVSHQSAWSHAYDAYDKLSNDDLYYLYKRAQDLNKIFDELECMQAHNDMKLNKQKEKKEQAAAAGAMQKGGVVPDPQQRNSLVQPKKSEAQILKELYLVKQKYKPYNIFIFECVKCSLFMMLHQKNCPHCSKLNIYYDGDLQIGKQIEQDVVKLLEDFQKELKKKNQVHSNQIQYSGGGGSVNPGIPQNSNQGQNSKDPLSQQAPKSSNHYFDQKNQKNNQAFFQGDQDVGVDNSGGGLYYRNEGPDSNHQYQANAGNPSSGGQNQNKNGSGAGQNDGTSLQKNSVPASAPVQNAEQREQVEDDRTTNRDSQDSNRTQDFDVARKEPDGEQAAEEEDQEKLVTVWRCIKCNHFNLFGNNPFCTNTRGGCKYNISYIDDIMKSLQQLTVDQYNAYVARHGGAGVQPIVNEGRKKGSGPQPPKKKDKKSEESNPIKEDEWVCEHCNTKNRMTGDVRSAQCRKCKKQNQVILWLIQAKQDQNQAKQEVQVLNHYKQKRSKQVGNQEYSHSKLQQSQPSQQNNAQKSRNAQDQESRGHRGSQQPGLVGAEGVGQGAQVLGQGVAGSQGQGMQHQEQYGNGFGKNNVMAVPSSTSGSGIPHRHSYAAGYTGSSAGATLQGQQYPNYYQDDQRNLLKCQRCMSILQQTDQGLFCFQCYSEEQRRKQGGAQDRVDPGAGASRQKRDRANTYNPIGGSSVPLQGQYDHNRQARELGGLGSGTHQQVAPQNHSKIVNITSVDPSTLQNRGFDQQNQPVRHSDGHTFTQNSYLQNQQPGRGSMAYNQVQAPQQEVLGMANQFSGLNLGGSGVGAGGNSSVQNQLRQIEEMHRNASQNKYGGTRQGQQVASGSKYPQQQLQGVSHGARQYQPKQPQINNFYNEQQHPAGASYQDASYINKALGASNDNLAGSSGQNLRHSINHLRLQPSATPDNQLNYFHGEQNQRKYGEGANSVHPQLAFQNQANIRNFYPEPQNNNLGASGGIHDPKDGSLPQNAVLHQQNVVNNYSQQPQVNVTGTDYSNQTHNILRGQRDHQQYQQQHADLRGGISTPQQYQHQVIQQRESDEDDEKFERKGDFYQCIKCEQYTVHVHNDRECLNNACPSNMSKKRLADSAGSKSYVQAAQMQSQFVGGIPAQQAQQQIYPPKSQLPDANYSKVSSRHPRPQNAGADSYMGVGLKNSSSTIQRVYCKICGVEVVYQEYKQYSGQCYTCSKRSREFANQKISASNPKNPKVYTNKGRFV